MLGWNPTNFFPAVTLVEQWKISSSQQNWQIQWTIKQSLIKRENTTKFTKLIQFMLCYAEYAYFPLNVVLFGFGNKKVAGFRSVYYANIAMSVFIDVGFFFCEQTCVPVHGASYSKVRCMTGSSAVMCHVHRLSEPSISATVLAAPRCSAKLV